MSERTFRYRDHHPTDYNYNKFYIYVLKCCGDKEIYYVGQTAHLTRRMVEHITGRGSSFTEKYLPCGLAHLEVVGGRKESLQRESKLIWKVKKKDYSFMHLPPEFSEFYYRIAAILSPRDPMLPTTFSPELLADCINFIEIPYCESFDTYNHVSNEIVHVCEDVFAFKDGDDEIIFFASALSDQSVDVIGCSLLHSHAAARSLSGSRIYIANIAY